MKQYNVTGMSCAACSSRVEKAVSTIKGVTSCSVSLLTNSMGVEGTASDEEIIKAVKDAGYSATVKSPTKKNYTANPEDALADRETPVLKRRLMCSVGFLIVLMYFSMGHTMLDLPIPSFFKDNYIGLGLVQLLLSAMVMVINQKFFINGFKGILHKSPNMDTLVALGSAAAFIYSTYSLFAMIGEYADGNFDFASEYMHEFYFESAAMILTLITVGKMLETRSKGKTTDALKSLMRLAPKTANIIIDGKETTVSIEQVKIGDIFSVRPGESVPVDGIVIKGSSAVNESALTGESIPVDKETGSAVSAATVNLSGYMECEATRVGEDTTLSQIIKMVSDAAATKAPIAKIADKVSGFFVPVVILIATLTILIWLLLGETTGFALARGISVLVISCPCALGLATPVAIMVGNGVGAKHGILFKTAASLEQTGKVQTVVLDKTGTITQGEPEVTDIVPFGELSENELLEIAYALESKSEHPLAKAIVKRAETQDITAMETTEFQILPGNGLQACINEETVFGGNFTFISGKTEISDNVKTIADELSAEGKTPLYFACADKLCGIIAVADVIKADSFQAIKELKNMGIHTVMLTGDNKRTAEAIGKQAGVNEIIADVLPDGKERVICAFCEKGATAMVGDGINDAPALTRAHTGIAIGAGTDVALDAADIVLMNSSLLDVSAAIRLSRTTLRCIKQNLFWAFIYNIIGIPLAAGCYIGLFGWEMNPMFGALAMSLSSVCVVTNALRLNLVNIRSAKNDRKIKTKVKENKQMEKVIRIEGMMCTHCEARVKKVLEEIDGVTEVVASQVDGTATVKMSKDVSGDILKNAIEEQGYKVI